MKKKKKNRDKKKKKQNKTKQNGSDANQLVEIRAKSDVGESGGKGGNRLIEVVRKNQVRDGGREWRNWSPVKRVEHNVCDVIGYELGVQNLRNFSWLVQFNFWYMFSTIEKNLKKKTNKKNE